MEPKVGLGKSDDIGAQSLWDSVLSILPVKQQIGEGN